MKTKFILAVLAVIAIGIVGYFYFKTVQNPEIKWEVEPDYAQNEDEVYGPRDQRYKPGGRSSYPDNGLDNPGRSKGLVIFGPIVSGGMGHQDSKATAKFKCGDGDKCTIVVRISGQVAGGAAGKEYERMKLKAELVGRLSSDSITPHKGNGGSKAYTLSLNGCGDVKLTAEFDETINASNPEGIQTRFSVQIVSYGCSSGGVSP